MPQVGGEAVWHEKNRGPIQRNRWTPRLKHEPTRKQWKKLIIAWQSSILHALRFYDAVFTVCMRACKKDELDLFEYAFRTGVLLMVDVFDYEGND